MEILVVVVILGILAAVVVFTVRGSKESADTSACAADARVVAQAAEAYLAQESLDEVPALGTSDDRHELFLVDAGLLTQVSILHDLHADGTVTTTGDPCP